MMMRKIFNRYSLESHKIVQGVLDLILGHVDLLLASLEEDINTTVDLLAVGSGIEDIADGLSLVEGVVGDLL